MSAKFNKEYEEPFIAERTHLGKLHTLLTAHVADGEVKYDVELDDGRTLELGFEGVLKLENSGRAAIRRLRAKVRSGYSSGELHHVDVTLRTPGDSSRWRSIEIDARVSDEGLHHLKESFEHLHDEMVQRLPWIMRYGGGAEILATGIVAGFLTQAIAVASRLTAGLADNPRASVAFLIGVLLLVLMFVLAEVAKRLVRCEIGIGDGVERAKRLRKRVAVFRFLGAVAVTLSLGIVSSLAAAAIWKFAE